MPITTVPCSNAAKTRKPLKCARVPQTGKPISAVIEPTFTILWGHVEEILLFNKFFQLLISALVAKIQPDKVARWCADDEFWRFFTVLITFPFILQRTNISILLRCCQLEGIGGVPALQPLKKIFCSDLRHAQPFNLRARASAIFAIYFTTWKFTLGKT